MFQQFYAGLLFAVGLLSPKRDARLQFLLLQIRMLKCRLKSDRVVPTPEEKAELLRLGAALHDDIHLKTRESILQCTRRKIPIAAG